MASAFSIEVDFRKSMKRVQQLRDLADKLGKIAGKEMDSVAHSVSLAWRGDESKAFLKKADILQDKLADMTKNLNMIAQAIEEAATETYNAEKAALARALQREY